MKSCSLHLKCFLVLPKQRISNSGSAISTKSRYNSFQGRFNKQIKASGRMCLASEIIPPVLSGKRKEQTIYMQSRPRRRVNILCDYAKNPQFGLYDMLALGIEQIKDDYYDHLPPGYYANARGYWFRVTTSGGLRRLKYMWPSGYIWLPGPAQRPPPPQLPLHMQFVAGSWQRQVQSLPVVSDAEVADAMMSGFLNPVYGSAVPGQPTTYQAHQGNADLAPAPSTSYVPDQQQQLNRIAASMYEPLPVAQYQSTGPAFEDTNSSYAAAAAADQESFLNEVFNFDFTPTSEGQSSFPVGAGELPLFLPEPTSPAVATLDQQEFSHPTLLQGENEAEEEEAQGTYGIGFGETLTAFDHYLYDMLHSSLTQETRTSIDDSIQGPH